MTSPALVLPEAIHAGGSAEVWGWFAVALFGVLGSAMCSGLETAVYSVSRVRLSIRGAADAGARLLSREIRSPDRVLSTLLVSNNAFNYVGVLGVTALLERTGMNEWALLAVNAAIVTPILLVFAESVPKELARVHADKLGPKGAWIIWGMRWVWTVVGVVPLVHAAGRLAGRAIGLSPGAGLSSGRTQVAALLREGVHQAGVLRTNDDLIERAMAFSRTRVDTVAMPWVRRSVVREDFSASQALRVIRGSGRDAVPVVDRNGKVIGAVSALGLHAAKSSNDHATAADAIEPCPRVKPTATVREALGQLSAVNAELGVVIRQKRPVGVVTRRVLVEPLTGDLTEW